MRVHHVQSGISFFLVAIGGLALGVSGTAQGQGTASAALTSDYVWRGSSQTQEDPAIQAGFKYSHESGLYASVWGSNVKFNPSVGANSEFDIALGWSGSVSTDWALDVYLLRYEYPDTDLNWNEVNVAVTWRDNYWLALGHSTNALASDMTGTYVLLGSSIPLNDQWRIDGAVARYFLESDYADSYTHGSVGVVWSFNEPFEARLTLHDTDSAAKRLFPDMAGSRVEFALQASF